MKYILYWRIIIFAISLMSQTTLTAANTALEIEASNAGSAEWKTITTFDALCCYEKKPVEMKFHNILPRKNNKIYYGIIGNKLNYPHIKNLSCLQLLVWDPKKAENIIDMYLYDFSFRNRRTKLEIRERPMTDQDNHLLNSD